MKDLEERNMLMGIADNLNGILSELHDNVKLIAVSKTKSVEAIMEAYNAGQRAFGENRVQELIDKQPRLPGDIEWHHIGHLQTNKVKYLAPFVSLIHAVDSRKLLLEINKQGARNDRKIPCLLQVHIAEEETKYGFSKEELLNFIDSLPGMGLANAEIRGLMGMATFTSDYNQVRKEFRFLNDLFIRIKNENNSFLPSFNELSMGMSGDYQIAIEEGSSMIRVGSLIFGSRG